MDYLPIITSCIAIVVACISGLFSYYSSKRSAKVQAMQAYLSFLQHKMAKLEEALKSTEYIEKQKESEKKSKDNIMSSLADSLWDHKKYCEKILNMYGYLFTDERKDEYDKLLQFNDKLGLNLAVLMSKGTKLSLKDEYKDQLLEPDEIVKGISSLHNDLKYLIVKELEATYKEFRELSLK